MKCNFTEVRPVQTTTTPSEELARHNCTRLQIENLLLAQEYYVVDFRLPKSGEWVVYYGTTQLPYITQAYGNMNSYRPLLIIRPISDRTNLTSVWE